MKNLNSFFLIILIVILLTTSLKSQIAINSFHKPTIGDTLELRDADSTGVHFGQGGANLVWDYSNIQLKSNTFYEIFVTPSSTPYYSYYPNSNLASINSDSPVMYHYYNTTGIDWITNGFVQSGNIITYTDPVCVMHYPLTYGSQFIKTDYAEGYGGSFTYYYSGTRTFLCDGYGTLILPNMTYNNVLRLKIIYDVYTTVKMGGAVVYSEHTILTYYDWYSENSKFPVFIIMEYISDKSPYYFKKPSLVYKNPVIGINRISEKIPEEYKLYQNYPNPFNPETKIKFSIKKTGFTALKVFDVLGREVKTLVNENLKQGEYELMFSSEQLSGGTYFYTLETENFKNSKKMIVVK